MNYYISFSVKNQDTNLFQSDLIYKGIPIFKVKLLTLSGHNNIIYNQGVEHGAVQTVSRLQSRVSVIMDNVTSKYGIIDVIKAQKSEFVITFYEFKNEIWNNSGTDRIIDGVPHLIIEFKEVYIQKYIEILNDMSDYLMANKKNIINYNREQLSSSMVKGEDDHFRGGIINYIKDNNNSITQSKRDVIEMKEVSLFEFIYRSFDVKGVEFNQNGVQKGSTTVTYQAQ